MDYKTRGKRSGMTTTVPVQLVSPAGSVAGQALRSQGPSLPPAWVTESTVSVYQFGAKGNGVADDTAALAAANAYLAAHAPQVKLVFPAGIYVYSSSPNWAIPGAQIEACGEVKLRYTGTGNAVNIDAGSGSQQCFNMSMGRFIVECPSTASDAVFVRSVHHSRLSFDVRGAGANASGLHVQFAVCTHFPDFTCSVNEGGWYNGATPLNGINLDIRNSGETTSYCTFVNPIIEGPGTGVRLTSTLGNIFLGGTSEGCGTQGLYAASGAKQDRFIGMDFEANGPSGARVDAFIQGTGIEMIGCDTLNRVEFGTTSNTCSLVGGRHSNVAFDSGSKGNSAVNVRYNRFGDGSTYVDGGSLNQSIGVQDGSTSFGYLTGSLSYTPGTIAANASIAAVIAVPGVTPSMPFLCSFSSDLKGLTLTAYCKTAGAVTVVFANTTGASQTIAAGTIFVQGLKMGG